jgi:hypothetical protein
MDGCEHDKVPETRTEGRITLAVYGAMQEALARGLAAARKIFDNNDVMPSQAGVRNMAVQVFKFDPTLRAPDDEVLSAAAAFVAAGEAAVRIAEGTHDQGDHMAVEQWPHGRRPVGDAADAACLPQQVWASAGAVNAPGIVNYADAAMLQQARRVNRR